MNPSTALVVLIPALPLGVALVGAHPRTTRLAAAAAPLAAAGVTLAGAILAADVLGRGPMGFLRGFVRVDALSAFMVLLVGLVATVATAYGVSYVQAELESGRSTPAAMRSYGILVQGLVAAMLVAVLADNLGLMWVAVEATTIATGLLVAQRRSGVALEAAWKYVVIGSVGVALAFLGTVLVYFASVHAGSPGDTALNWSSLRFVAPELDPGVMRLAVGLLVLGYGTKVGLAPMHTWVPDTYSQAPAPVSALIAGALPSIAFYALLRYKVIADAALGPDYLRGLLLAGALLSVVVAASLVIAQRDYQRLIAYSSLEHMGLVVLGGAIGSPLAIAAALVHVLGHGLTKAVLFCCSGEIRRQEGSTEIASVRGLLARRPIIGGAFGVGLLALLGFPPFSLFASQLAIARAGFASGLGWAVVAVLALTVVIFAAVLGHAQRMLLGAPAAGPAATEEAPPSRLVLAPLALGLGLVALLGVSISPIERLVRTAAEAVSL